MLTFKAPHAPPLLPCLTCEADALLSAPSAAVIDCCKLDGDFAMTEQELQGVLKPVRGAHIDIVAIHNHMTGESPRIMFLHFWGVGSTTDLAKGIKAALDSQNTAKG